MQIEVSDEFIMWANVRELPPKGETPEESVERLTLLVNTVLRDYMIRHRIDAEEELPPTDREPMIDA